MVNENYNDGILNTELTAPLDKLNGMKPPRESEVPSQVYSGNLLTRPHTRVPVPSDHMCTMHVTGCTPMVVYMSL